MNKKRIFTDSQAQQESSKKMETSNNDDNSIYELYE